MFNFIRAMKLLRVRAAECLFSVCDDVVNGPLLDKIGSWYADLNPLEPKWQDGDGPASIPWETVPFEFQMDWFQGGASFALNRDGDAFERITCQGRVKTITCYHPRVRHSLPSVPAPSTSNEEEGTWVQLDDGSMVLIVFTDDETASD